MATINELETARCSGLSDLTVKLGVWISVKDRLPDPSTTVLCCCKWDFVVGYEDPSFIEIRTFATKKFVDSKGKKVTHWMQLPEIPNE